jgi:mevalonate kinase
MNSSYTASAPGSLMLLGEHAVLHGQLALVCAVNRRIQVTLIPRKDRTIRISSALGRYRMTMDEIKPSKTFRFVIAALRRFATTIPSGFDLRIDSEFSHRVGLGSSAAVTVATLAVLKRLVASPAEAGVQAQRAWLQDLLKESVNVIRETQGLGSGADVAASVYGGVVLYRAPPIRAVKLKARYPLTVIYSGSKKPTVEVVRQVEKARITNPALFGAIFRLMGQSSRKAAAAIRRKNWKEVGAIMNFNQGLMAAIGVSNAKLSEIAYALQADPGILGSKISGSGLGDCVIGLGNAKRKKWPYAVLAVEMTENGVRMEQVQHISAME